MRQSRKQRLCVAAAACCAGVAGIVLADDIPFLKSGTSLPTRAPSSQVTSAVAAPMDSRTVQTVASAPVKFDSSSQPGLSILVR